MHPDRWNQVKELYHRALDAEPESRAPFLREACADDAELYREVDSLLNSETKAKTFIDATALEDEGAPAPAEKHETLAGNHIGKYEIVRLLGSGGMGEVYLARDTRLHRFVALKLLPARLASDKDAGGRFLREARAAAALEHPNICAIHEIGEEDNSNFIVMQYVEGETLADKLSHERMSFALSFALAMQITDALAEAHTRSIIHRDIKPANVIVTPRGQVKVLDFGLAKFVSGTSDVDGDAKTITQLSTPGMIVGTVPYMSPEQVRGEELDASSDVFSLGVLLYELWSGQQPFLRLSAAETIAAILTHDPPFARDLNALPEDLLGIVRNCLMRDKKERYATAKNVLADLRRFNERQHFSANSAPTVISDKPASVTQEFPDPKTAGASADWPFAKLEAEFEAKRDGMQSPHGPGISSAASPPPKVDAPTSGTSNNSNARYLTRGAARHKAGVAMAVAALLVAIAAGVAYWARNGNAIESVAVLPFVNENPDPNVEYLSDGITESLINSLSQLSGLKVMSRNSVFRFKGKESDAKEVGQKLGVRAVLTGRVMQRGESLAISIDLVDALDNSQIWGKQYNRKSVDMFAVQQEIAKDISERLRLKLTGAERQQLAKRPTENLKAYQYYMQGRSFAQRRTREDLQTAIDFCQKAIDEDSNYALAYAGLAEAYSVMGMRGYIAPLEGQRKADAAAGKALSLDANLAEAHVAVSQVRVLFAPYDLPKVEQELRRAIELSPSLAVPHMYLAVSSARQGRYDETRDEILKARELDPLSLIIARAAAMPDFFKRDYARAYETLRQADELGPSFIVPFEIGVYIQKGSFDAALAKLDEEKRGTPTVQPRTNDPILVYSTGMVYAAQGKRAEALKIIKELEAMSGENFNQAHWIAKVYAALNEKELAFGWLERGLSAGAIGDFYKDEPVWDSIRDDQRFTDLLRRMGITQ